METKKGIPSKNAKEKMLPQSDSTASFDPDIEDIIFIDEDAEDAHGGFEDYLEEIGHDVLPRFLVKCPSIVSLFETKENGDYLKSSPVASKPTTCKDVSEVRDNSPKKAMASGSPDDKLPRLDDSDYLDSVESASSAHGLLVTAARKLANGPPAVKPVNTIENTTKKPEFGPLPKSREVELQDHVGKTDQNTLEALDLHNESYNQKCMDIKHPSSPTNKVLANVAFELTRSRSRFSVEKVPEVSVTSSPTSELNNEERHVTFNSTNEVFELIMSQQDIGQSQEVKDTKDDQSSTNDDSLHSTSSTQGLLARAARTYLRIRGENVYGYTNDDSLQSTSSQQGLLSRYARKIAYDAMYEKPRPREAKKYMKNLIALSLSFMFVFSSFTSLRNLQSSLNPTGGLGLLSLSVMYGVFVLASLTGTAVTQILRPKNTLILGMAMQACYVTANFYPSPFLLVPASALAGFANATMWIAQGTYIASIASSYATVMKKRPADVMNKFYGIFFMIWQMSNIIGNLTASLVLNSPNYVSTAEHLEDVYGNNSNLSEVPSLNLEPKASGTPYIPDDSTNRSTAIVMLFNSTFKDTSPSLLNTSTNFSSLSHSHLSLCGSGYCHSMKLTHNSGEELPKHIIYILIAVYLFCVLAGLAITVCFVDRLRKIFQRKPISAREQLKALVSTVKDHRQQLLVFLQFYTGIRAAFIAGDFTKAFITCPLGMEMIGYTMICFGVCNAASAITNGRLAKHISTRTLLGTASLIDLCLGVVLATWQPIPEQQAVLFVITGLWGVADGIWATQLSSLVGTLFSNNKEPAYASMKFFQGFAIALSFGFAPYICMAVKTYIYLGMLVAGMISYTVLDAKLKRESENEGKS
ncbi:UNC93-like protein [Lingula anatina]|uniref:UNC93-like protein n=1 Tax=Lingula anatina TaxID=7574 RepID=A0A1S3H2Q7_LINAN|nr:UNC93-like protein [Lingula anatina]|eukprot:XP_013380298.1 UNC93-like protein [Lingula anatina]